jgi:hypothetical protein
MVVDADRVWLMRLHSTPGKSHPSLPLFFIHHRLMMKVIPIANPLATTAMPQNRCATADIKQSSALHNRK